MKISTIRLLWIVLAVFLFVIIGCTPIHEYIKAGGTEQQLDSELCEGVLLSDPYEISFDAEVFYTAYGTILEKQTIMLDDMQSEQEVSQLLKRRGFNQYPIVSSYTSDGKYTGEIEISEDGTEKYPVYETYYLSENEEFWTITYMNGFLTALPEKYNFDTRANTLTVIAESDELMSYDSATQSYYKTIPNADLMRIVAVKEVNASTLEELSLKGIDG